MSSSLLEHEITAHDLSQHSRSYHLFFKGRTRDLSVHMARHTASFLQTVTVQLLWGGAGLLGKH